MQQNTPTTIINNTPLNPRSADPTVSVVIPTLNEAKNLPIVLPQLPEGLHEVIIVDGRSTDDTIEVARALLPDCVVVLEERKGKGHALNAGFNAATGDIIVMIDADGSMDPAEIPGMVQALVDGADCSKGSRYLDGGGSTDITWHRSLGNLALCALVNLRFGVKYSELCYGYIAFWRDVLPALNPETAGFEVETKMLIRMATQGLTMTETPSFEADRIHGESNLNAWSDGWRVLRTIVRESFRPTTPAPVNQFVTVFPVPAPVAPLSPAMEIPADERFLAVA
ncbi:MAG: glycosyltransferase family 2 protein [Actinomycetota bacterium]